ncbi:MAG: N-acetylmuramoyl-L-alanine amidase [Ruminococcus sp.]
MEKEVKKKAAEIVLGCLLLFGVYLLSQEGARLVSQTAVEEQTVVVDAGHGGRDPGKVGAGDVLEKEINLEIALKLKERLEKRGIQVIMTRTEDVMLCEEDSSNKKAQDLKNRCGIIDESGADCAVSIHQNSYSDESVKGPQVFYYQNSDSGRELAETLQEALVSRLAPESSREARGNETYYMLRKTKTPVVIVECGFLSNPEEAGRLCEEKYQEQIADAVCEGVAAYLKK